MTFNELIRLPVRLIVTMIIVSGMIYADAPKTIIPAGRHTDWPWPLKYIPRRWTAVSSDHPPAVIFGRGLDDHDPDVPPPGGWSFSVSKKFGFNFARTSKHRLHFRIGTFRYDYVDHYYEFPTFALKHIK